MFRTSRTLRTAVTAVAAGAFSLGLVTANTGTAAAAETVCSGTASVYGILPDGRLTYSAINPTNGDRIKTLTGADLGFTPQAMATLNFNTILVTSTSGALYRVDVQTNNTALTLASAPVRIADSGWTHDKLTYDGYGHLYGTTSSGLLLQYTVTEDKPAGSQHIGMRKEIDSGFVLKTLSAVGQDRLIATTVDGKLLSYQIVGDAWRRSDLKTDGWSAFDQLVSPGAGFYYGRIPTTGAMYWYKDGNISDGSGADIAYHTSDPVDASGWTQQLLSAAPRTVSCKSVSTLGQDIANAANAEVGKTFTSYPFTYDYAWCAEFVKYIWAGEDVDYASQLDARAWSLYKYGTNHGTWKTGSPKVGDAVLYDKDGTLGDNEADHVNIVVGVSSDGTQIQTVGGNESHKVSKSGWFTWKTASDPVGAGRVMGFASPIG
ncbi:CHAP domain-containing protein [Streptomyces mutabilis]|uniref:CHAP domain-containing protein n=2 Tax=Streptomyces mutabilis TaxID=67332 RepID=UPI0035F0660D